jgi:RecB family exonuclease
LERAAAPLSREAEAWRRALTFAQKRFLMFHSKRKDGQELSPHPFWDTIRNILDSPSLSRRCGELCKDGNWRLAGRTAALRRVERERFAPARGVCNIPPNLAVPRNLSYTQMSTLIACPMKWVFQYHAGLRTPDTLSLPTGNRMVGSLCHRIVHEIYGTPARRVSPEGAADEAARLYDALLPSMASELALEGKELENKRTRQTVIYAVRQLAESIERLGLTVEKSEEKLESSANGISCVGYADLVLRTRSGDRFVLDLKWTHSSRYRKEELEEGNALQLASYAWLLRSIDPDVSVHTGYFMLAQGELFSDSPLLGEDALPSKRSSDEIWNLAFETWNKKIQKLNEGVAEAKGVTEKLLGSDAAVQEPFYIAPPCVFCDFAVLCGLNEAGGLSERQSAFS